jgi:hypothetical protein
LRIDANPHAPHAETGPSTFAELVSHYRLKDLAGENEGRKAFSTRAAYECYLKVWILPRWGELTGSIRSSQSPWKSGTIASSGRKDEAKIRNLMSALFSPAMRYEWEDRNPI